MLTKLRVSKNFVGELVLPVFENRIIKAGYILSLNDEQLNNFAVQMAIKKGLLFEEKDESVVPKEVPAVEPEKVLENTEVKNDIVDEVEKEMSEKVETIEEIPEKDDNFNTLNLDDIITRDNTETKTNMQSWDFEEQKSLEKNESANVLMKKMNSTTAETIVKTTLEDKEINFNEVDVDKKIEEMTSKVKVSAMKKKTGKTKGKSLTPVGHKKEVGENSIIDEVMPNESEMAFVDQEQIVEDILNHPVLKEKFKNESDILSKI